MDSELRIKLLILIRNIFKDNYLVPNNSFFTKTECEDLLRFGDKQSIAPIIFQSLKTMNSSEIASILSKYEKSLLKAIYDDAQREGFFREISTVLTNAHIPFIPLKGIVIRNLYPETWMRTSCDIDILVHEKDLDNAIKEIEQHTDFKSTGYRSFHDVSLVSPKLHLELHFSIRENIIHIDELLTKVWDYSYPGKNDYQYEMSPEYLVFYTLAHMNHHITNGGIGIRPLLDIWLITNKLSLDQEKLNRLLESSHLAVFYEQTLRLLDTWMNGSESTATTSLFEKYCFSGGVFGTDKDSIVSRQRNHKGIRYLYHRLIVPKSFLQEEYPELRDKPHKAFYYQVQRWKRLMDKTKRNKVKQEIRSVRETNDEEIKEYDLFLKSLGL